MKKTRENGFKFATFSRTIQAQNNVFHQLKLIDLAKINNRRV